MYYADRLVQFPLGVFAMALATAVLPSLSRQAAQNRMEELSHTFGYAMGLVVFITAPAMVGAHCPAGAHCGGLVSAGGL